MIATGTAVERIPVAIVADQPVTRDTLAALVGEDAEIEALGVAGSVEEGEALLDDPRLRVLLVNLGLTPAPGREPPGVGFIRHAKQRRPDVGILSLKRAVDEAMLRAALDAGADACCLVTTPFSRLRGAIKAVAAGATWLDPEISQVLLHHAQPPLAHRLSPRERSVLRLIVDGYSNAEIGVQLGCSAATIHTYVLRLFRKLGVRDRVTAAVCALRSGLV